VATETLALRTVATADTGTGMVSVVGSNIYLGDGSTATAIATVAGGTSGSNLVVTANAAFPADHTVMQKIALLVTYHNSSDLSAANTSQTRTLTVTASDNAGTPAISAFTQSIKLIEVNDPVSLTAPTAISYTDTSANDTFNATSANLSASDPDSSSTITYGLDGGTLSGSIVTKVGTYGTLTVNASSGAYTYTPNDVAINALTSNATDIFSVTASDGSGSTDSQTLTVNLTAANDAPVVVLDKSSVTYVDTGAATYTTATGSFGSSDRDATAATVSYAIMDGATPVLTLSGTYGTLTITNANTGTYEFVPNALGINALSASSSLSETFTIRVSDSSNASSTANFTVNAVGANSTPQLLGGAAAKTLAESTPGIDATGSLSVADIDISDTITVSRSVLASGTLGAFSAGDSALLAMLTLSSDNSTFDTTATPTSGTQERALYWKFNSGGEAFNYLANGESLVLTYTLTAADNATTPLTDTETVTITITGTNDAPVISLATGDANSAGLTENGTNPLVASDTLTVSDVDTSDVVTASVVLTSSNTGTSSRTDPAAPTDSELLAMFSVSPSPVLNASTSSALLTWYFDAGAETFDYLAAGETLILTYTVTATDDNGTPLSDSETVTITITGTNDAPVLNATRTTATYTDTAADDTFNTVSGQLSSPDVDTKDGAT
jgi:VCBS repeat-containing protein